jgi:hypothetical protein
MSHYNRLYFTAGILKAKSFCFSDDGSICADELLLVFKIIFIECEASYSIERLLEAITTICANF